MRCLADNYLVKDCRVRNYLVTIAGHPVILLQPRAGRTLKTFYPRRRASILPLHFGTLGGLFLAAFLAATILPAQSEAGLAALILGAPSSVTLLVITASLGNILGSVVNWYLGRGLTGFAGRSWFPPSAGQLARATDWYDKYGRWSLLLSWVPIIGDPLTLVAGIMREPLPRFLLIVGIAKIARYVVVAALALQWL